MQSKAVRYAMPLIAVLAILAIPSAAHAQGCAMCYQSAAASGARLIHALKNGILVMMFPPMLITIGLARLAYKKRNEFRDGAEMPESDPVDTTEPTPSNEIILKLYE
jgi:hypothetical protein